jgi:hypothetical protein
MATKEKSDEDDDDEEEEEERREVGVSWKDSYPSKGDCS